METDPEFMEAMQVSSHFVSDLSLLDVKWMLRAREESTKICIPMPILALQSEAVDESVTPEKCCKRNIMHTSYLPFLWYWILYQLRSRVFTLELQCDTIQSRCRDSFRLISNGEERMYREMLINRFATDMYFLKINKAQEDSPKNDGSVDGDLLQKLMEKYEGKTSKSGPSGMY